MNMTIVYFQFENFSPLSALWNNSMFLRSNLISNKCLYRHCAFAIVCLCVCVTLCSLLKFSTIKHHAQVRRLNSICQLANLPTHKDNYYYTDNFVRIHYNPHITHIYRHLYFCSTYDIWRCMLLLTHLLREYSVCSVRCWIKSMPSGSSLWIYFLSTRRFDTGLDNLIHLHCILHWETPLYVTSRLQHTNTAQNAQTEKDETKRHTFETSFLSRYC